MGDNLEASAGRCVFSASLNRQTLEVAAGAPPGALLAGPPGLARGWQAVVRVLRSPSEIARGAFDDFVTTVFPAECRVCDGPLLRAGTMPVCDACVEGITTQSGTLCGCCGEALGIELDLEDERFLGMLAEGILCAPCRQVPPEFVRAVAFGVYEDALREMVHLLKYDGVRPMAEPLGRMLAEAMAGLRGVAADEALVMAVPLHAAREAQRGYNQSVLLADAAVRVLRVTAPGWKLTAAHTAMRRKRHTESQYVLSPRGRRANLRGAFEVTDKALVAGREVVLVDDIYTSGATARECARVLRRAGAAKVWVATLSRAQVQRARAHVDVADDVAIWGN